MKLSTTILSTFFVLCGLSNANAQGTSALEIKGRVLEMVNNKKVGIPKITVKVAETSSDITASDGTFRIVVPSNRTFIQLSIVDANNREMLNPKEGIVPLPPSGYIDIYVCAKQNEALRAKVAALNREVTFRQKKFELSNRQVMVLQKEMLDTVMYYEGKLQMLQEINDRIKNESLEKDKALRESEARIQALEQELKRTVEELFKAKDEYFLKKNEHLQKITAELRGYLDALQNLGDMVQPDRIPQYFSYYPEAATNKLNGKIEEYNSARDLILKNQDANLTATRHYWQDPSVALQLKETYDFLLTTVHLNNVLPMNTTVIGIMKAYQAHKLGRQQAEKNAKNAVNDAYPKLKSILPTLEEKINSTISNLKQNF